MGVGPDMLSFNIKYFWSSAESVSAFTTLALATTVEDLGSEELPAFSCAVSDNENNNRIKTEYKVVTLIIFAYGLGCKATLFCSEIIGFFQNCIF